MNHIGICKADSSSLPQINEVISAAIMRWDLPERVKRLSIPQHHYDETDLKFLDISVAKLEAEIIAVFATEVASVDDLPEKVKGLLLHGIYVKPDRQKNGLGRYLLQQVEYHAETNAYSGVLVKAHPGAIGFFERSGYKLLPIESQDRQYAHRMWKKIASH